jgi:hypothetical protein
MSRYISVLPVLSSSFQNYIEQTGALQVVFVN